MSDRSEGVLRIDLRKLRAERGATLVVTWHEPIASHVDEIPFVEPVEGTLTLVNLGPVLHVDGRFQTRVDLICDLCATPFGYRLEAPLDEELAWSRAAGSPADAAAGGDEFLVRRGDSIFLDVEALAREALVLALPMIARCNPDCRGLCPRCGSNLRLEPCRCAAESDAGAGDPRLQPLAGWHNHRSSSGSAS